MIKTWWLIPWSVGWECRSQKPDGESIPVIMKSAYDALEAEIIQLKHDQLGFDSELDYQKEIERLKAELEKSVERTFEWGGNEYQAGLKEGKKELQQCLDWHDELRIILQELVDEYTPDHNGKTKYFNFLIKQAREALEKK